VPEHYSAVTWVGRLEVAGTAGSTASSVLVDEFPREDTGYADDCGRRLGHDASKYCGFQTDRKQSKKSMANKKQPNPIDIHVGSRVRLRRMMLSMSQEKLGDHLGITFQQIQKYEKGTNRIGASRLQHIARVLSVPVAFFFEDAPGTPGETGIGMAEQQQTTYVVDFLSSNEGIQLNRAFLRIQDAKVRRRIIDLIRALAGENPDA
jgi:transcriptional regulator with XRE-family HTH domain